MERMIIGLENVDYISRKSGEPVKGLNLHTVGVSANVKGKACEKFFVSAKAEGIYPVASKLNVNDLVDIQFNRFGGIDAIYTVTDK